MATLASLQDAAICVDGDPVVSLVPRTITGYKLGSLRLPLWADPSRDRLLRNQLDVIDGNGIAAAARVISGDREP
jgi:hypothetical protein